MIRCTADQHVGHSECLCDQVYRRPVPYTTNLNKAKDGMIVWARVRKVHHTLQCQPWQCGLGCASYTTMPAMAVWARVCKVRYEWSAATSDTSHQSPMTTSCSVASIGVDTMALVPYDTIGVATSQDSGSRWRHSLCDAAGTKRGQLHHNPSLRVRFDAPSHQQGWRAVHPPPQAC